MTKLVAQTKSKIQQWKFFLVIEEVGGSKKHGKTWEKFPSCSYCKRRNHTENFCWYKPDASCRVCNQVGNIEKVSRNRQNQQG